MLSEFYNRGWVYEGNCKMVQENTCMYFSLRHPKYPTVSLEIRVSLNEIPALTIVSLIDSDGIIEYEWSDEEISVFDITERAINYEIEGGE